MNFFDHKDLGNHLLQLCPKIVKNPVFASLFQGFKHWHLNKYFYPEVFKTKSVTTLITPVVPILRKVKAAIAQSVQRHATDWTVREIFRTRPGQPCGPPSLVYNGYRVFTGGKADGEWCYLPSPSSVDVKEKAELYLYPPTPHGFHGLLRGVEINIKINTKKSV